MSYGPAKAFTVTVAASALVTTVADLTKAWANITLEVPSMTSGTELFIQGSSDNTTFRRIFHPIGSSVANPTAQQIASSVTNCFVPLVNAAVQYLRVELPSGPTSAAHTFKFVCFD
jgi:hypothetical protein